MKTARRIDHKALLAVPLPHSERPHGNVVESVVQGRTGVALAILDRKPPRFVHVSSLILTGRMTDDGVSYLTQVRETCQAPRSRSPHRSRSSMPIPSVR
jgi:hypothetical protein